MKGNTRNERTHHNITSTRQSTRSGFGARKTLECEHEINDLPGPPPGSFDVNGEREFRASSRRCRTPMGDAPGAPANPGRNQTPCGIATPA